LQLSLALWHAVARLISPLGTLSVEVLLERDLRDPIEPVSATIEVTVRQAEEQELDRITHLYSRDPYLYLGEAAAGTAGEREALESYRQRMRRGEKCFMALVDGEIVHVNWICFEWGEAIPGHPFFPRTGEVYTTDGFTAEQFRRRNIHAVVLGAMLRYAQQAGYRTAYTVARLDRHDVFHAFPQLGWRVAGKLLCFTPRGAQTAWILRRSGRIHGFAVPSEM
jgi:GNAT superfamily N-acetyltransferase